MSRKGHGQLRQSQVITTYGPGALIDLPRHSAIVGGLDTWPNPGEPGRNHGAAADPQAGGDDRRSVAEALCAAAGTERAVGAPTGNRGVAVSGVVRGAGSRGRRPTGALAAPGAPQGAGPEGTLRRPPVVPTRFVRACPRGHVDDVDWAGFVHGPEERCRRQLWLEEVGTTGDLADLFVRCECGKRRPLYEAAELDQNPLGTCRGARPWLGINTNEGCNHPSRLLIRTASNAYFPQVVSALSLPDRGTAVEGVVRDLWDDLQIVDDEADLAFIRKKPKVAEALAPFQVGEVLEAVAAMKGGQAGERPVKQVELEALLRAPEGFADDVPIDPDFHARRLPDAAWRKTDLSAGIESVVQLHRLREVLALIGFTRLEAVMPDIHGEYETDVERADIALEPQWFPAVENRGEGVFVHVGADAIADWLQRPAVQQRLEDLRQGHLAWAQSRRIERPFPGGPYVLLHTLSHLLIRSLAMRCGYPASSIRERIYVEDGAEGLRYGILLYTGTPDAEGTLGGLVQQARHIEDHLADALRMGALCSNDPICAQHAPGTSMEGRWLHGSACHGCALIAETSCEMRNDYLDRALVVPVLGLDGAAFFQAPP